MTVRLHMVYNALVVMMDVPTYFRLTLINSGFNARK